MSSFFTDPDKKNKFINITKGILFTLLIVIILYICIELFWPRDNFVTREKAETIVGQTSNKFSNPSYSYSQFRSDTQGQGDGVDYQNMRELTHKGQASVDNFMKAS